MSELRLYPGAVIVFWGTKWAHMSRRLPEPAIVIRVFDDGTFSSVGVNESGTYGRPIAKLSDYSCEAKRGGWCWPSEARA